jgi:hypothetical protein
MESEAKAPETPGEWLDAATQAWDTLDTWGAFGSHLSEAQQEAIETLREYFDRVVRMKN